MATTSAGMQRKLKSFDLQNLFVEHLGWNHLRARALDAPIDGRTFRLEAIAEKGGMVAYRCDADPHGNPDRSTRMKIDRWVAKNGAREHLIVFADAARGAQVWQWVKREAGRPEAGRQHVYHVSQPGDSLLQKLDALRFTLEDEEAGRTGVTVAWSRVRAGFDLEKVTKKFYERFQKEHTAFLGFLKGIPDDGMKRWYVSVMLNRLMFIYFIQKKGFLNGDLNYLRTKLAQTQRGGPDRYYRYFLCPLFFQGFALRKDQRPDDVKTLLGEVPYLNGGLFLEHQVEALHGKTIQLPDVAFERLFAFFESYQWNLDERPLKADNEINPDVLGYIFEKYINQKEMGAYYTKEDITGYISQNTIIPFLLDAARDKCRIAFEGDGSAWKLLQEDPDRYIYDAVRKGADRVLPPEIAAGLEDVSRRAGWNKPAPSDYALPTEIWREVIARRKRYEEVWCKLAAGEVRSTDDLITLNLNIRQFAQDLIQNCEGPELLRAVYYTIAGRLPEKSNEKVTPGMSVLDPTCGSGAFLFAALNVLEPLYEACLERMGDFLAELDQSEETHRPEKYADFRHVLARVDAHPNRRYFVFKSIVVNNLYGVDIMEEAVEICKLRLFLKLVAQLDSADKIEPLPDIDFNIRAGNTIVGYVSRDEVKRAVQQQAVDHGVQLKMLTTEDSDELQRIEQAAGDVESLLREFRRQQIAEGEEVTAADKAELRKHIGTLDTELNSYLAKEHGVNPKNTVAYKRWLDSHKPFHWFVEFYGTMDTGGFDVVIGNPPYVEMSDLKGQYTTKGLQLTSTGNLYSLCVERFSSILRRDGRLGVIVPISSVSTPRMLPLMKLLSAEYSPLHASNFAVRPGKLFVGADMNLTIFVGVRSPGGRPGAHYATNYNRWYGSYRAFLFTNLVYTRTALDQKAATLPKIGTDLEASILEKARAGGRPGAYVSVSGETERVFYHSGGRYFRKCLRDQLSNEYKPLTVSKGWGDPMICLMSSSFYYWLWIISSDCYHVTKLDIDTLPVPESLKTDPEVGPLAARLLDDLWANAEIRQRSRDSGEQQEEVNFYVGKSKLILDEIDGLLARHFRWSPVELDFLINYDIKYRLSNSD